MKKYPDDADAWYYLGLAFNGQGMIGAARSPFEHLIQLRPDSADGHAKLAYALILANQPQKALATAKRAIELGDQSPEAHYAIAEASFRTGADALRTGPLVTAVHEAETALTMKSDFLPALITKSLAHRSLQQYSEAAASLEKWLALSPDNIDADTWSQQLRLLQEQAERTNPAAQTTILTGKEVTQKARVLSKPEPQYTEAARMAAVEGTVVLRGIFSSDGEVKHLVFIHQALGYGLTTRAVRAARQIKFHAGDQRRQASPSMYIQLEYNFNLF